MLGRNTCQNGEVIAHPTVCTGFDRPFRLYLVRVSTPFRCLFVRAALSAGSLSDVHSCYGTSFDVSVFSLLRAIHVLHAANLFAVELFDLRGTRTRTMIAPRHLLSGPVLLRYNLPGELPDYLQVYILRTSLEVSLRLLTARVSSPLLVVGNSLRLLVTANLPSGEGLALPCTTSHEHFQNPALYTFTGIFTLAGCTHIHT